MVLSLHVKIHLRYTFALGFLCFFLPNLRSQCNLAVELTSQASVDNFFSNYQCDSILSLEITGLDITNLDGLRGLRYVENDVWIIETHLQNLVGLDSLRKIKTTLLIRDNEFLVSLQGLEQLTNQNAIIIQRAIIVLLCFTKHDHRARSGQADRRRTLGGKARGVPATGVY